MQTATGYTWHPIGDLPDDWTDLASTELPALADVWAEQKQELASSEALQRFNERLRREWAIETGVIERLYDIDRGITEVLIEHGIDASLIPHGATNQPPEEVVALIRDQERAVDWLFDVVANRRELSTAFIKGLHQLLTQHQETVRGVNGSGGEVRVPLRRGDWKRGPNSPMRPNGSVHEYCPPEQVASEMDRLMAMYVAHQKARVRPDVEAAWLHHRFTQIHPFQDGNGRVARCLATLVFLREGWFPLVITRSDDEYIRASEAADAGDLAPLTSLFVRVEKRAFVQALSISQQVVSERGRVSEVVAAAAARVRERNQAQARELARAFELAEPLFSIAEEQLGKLAQQLNTTMQAVAPHFEAHLTVCRNGEERSHWFRWQVIQAAQALGYFADLRTYHAWLRLRLRENRQEDAQTELLVSFHGLGETFRGVLAYSVVTFRKEATEDDDAAVTGFAVASQEVFQVNYKDEEQSVRARFERWLQESLVVALEQWRRSL